MNRNIIQEIQNTNTFFHDYKSTNSKSKPLLQQTLPKYRKQVLQRTLQSNSTNRTSRIKQKYRNFGEEDFLKKLKINSTKQIDRKSVKTIQKYLEQINNKNFKSAGYIIKANSISQGSLFDSEVQQQNENEQIVSFPIRKLQKNQSESIFSKSLKTKSAELVQNKFSLNKKRLVNKKCQEELNLQQNGHSQQDVKELKGDSSSKFMLLNKNKQIKNNKKPVNTNQKIVVVQNAKKADFISFRNNQKDYRSPVFNKNEEQSSCQNQQSKIRLSEYLNEQQILFQQSQNNFYYKVKQNKQRPTIDSDAKIEENHNYEITKGNDNQNLQQQIIRLRQKNKQQSEIIQLQQIMIEKLNIQLERAFQKLNQNTTINNKEMIKLKNQNNVNDFNENAQKNEQGDNKFKQIISPYKNYDEETYEFSQEISQKALAWNKNYSKLKDILESLSFQNPQNQSLNLEEPNSQDDVKKQKRPNFQSSNEFYHLLKSRKEEPEIDLPKIQKNKKFNYFSQINNCKDTQKYSSSSENQLDLDLIDYQDEN